MKVEMTGPRMACAVELFDTLDTQQMEKTLVKMQERLESRREWEASQK